MRYIIFILFIGLSFCADAQKRVVIEKFTNSSCGVCPNASLILEDIISRYDNVIWVSHYKNNGWFDNPLTNDQTAQLWSDLDVPGNPLGMIDRIPDDSFPFFVSNAWENRILELLGEEEISTVTIKNVNYNLASRLISFDTEVLFLENMSAGDYRVSAMIVEDEVTGQEQSSYYNEVAGHPLEGRGSLIWDYEHPNVVRTILDDTWGTEGVVPTIPQANEVYSHSYSYSVPEDYDPRKMKIVVMLTDHDETNVLNRKVYNADQVLLKDLGLELTSAASLLTDLGVSIYPNPVSDRLYVDSIDGSAQFSIVDINGKLVLEGQVSSGNGINISHLDTGTYFLSLQLDSASGVERFNIIR